jgi:hypothetical protein
MIEQPFPEGAAFLDLVSCTEDACVRETGERAPHLGSKAPECQKMLGNLLSLLYREASCFHGCSGGDHFGQRITGRVVSHALGSYRLLCSGYYDESLALSRNLGEVANLFWFFLHRPAELDRWRQSDEKTRKRDFSPVRIRIALENAGVPVPIDEARYAGLCETAVHAGPNTAPQAHNPVGVPTLGAVFQEAGYLASLNELAGATGVCAAGMIRLLNLGDREQRLKESSVALLRAVGGVDLAAVRNSLSGK